MPNASRRRSRARAYASSLSRFGSVPFFVKRFHPCPTPNQTPQLDPAEK